MPALLGPLVGFALGAAFAWIRLAEAPADGRRGGPPGVTICALFGALVYAPVNAYFLAFAGDWSLAYFVDSRK